MEKTITQVMTDFSLETMESKRKWKKSSLYYGKNKENHAPRIYIK